MAFKITSKGDITIIDDDHTIGMPPSTYISDSIVRNSMPQMSIIPATPDFTLGATLFQLIPAWDDYTQKLEKLGFGISSRSQALNLAFIADNFPTDTFSNEYGDSFLEGMATAASQGLSDVTQFFGARSATDLVKKMGTGGSEALNSLAGQGGMAGQIASGAATAIDQMTKMAGQVESAAQGPGVMNTILRTANTMAGGGRMDFPKVWKGSSFEPSYTLTCRLYNPHPGNANSTKKYIVGPLAAILLLATPISNAEGTYTWPYYGIIDCPGIYNLKAGYITSIAVIKGGDQQSIAWNQNLAVVDVRIDFGSLYSSILVNTSDDSNKDETRPTLKNYLEAMEGSKPTEAYPYENAPDGVGNSSVLDESNLPQPITITKESNSIVSDSTTPTSRVDSSLSDAANTIEDEANSALDQLRSFG